MSEEIKLTKREPTWNYILNDLALYSLMTKVIHSEEATYQEKFDLMYQIELLQQENSQLKERIEKAIEYIEKDTRWFDSEYASMYGTLCTCAGAKDDRLEVMVNPSNLLEILKRGTTYE